MQFAADALALFFLRVQDLAREVAELCLHELRLCQKVNLVLLAFLEGFLDGLALDDLAAEIAVGQSQFLDAQLRLLRALEGGDVGDDDAAPLFWAFGGRGARAVEVSPELRAVSPDERRFANLFACPAEDALKKREKDDATFLDDERRQIAVEQVRAAQTEQRRAGQVDFQNATCFVEREITDWREIVEVGVFLQQRFHAAAGFLEFGVLHFQFDMVDLQLVQDALGVHCHFRFGMRSCIFAHFDPRFGSKVKAGRALAFRARVTEPRLRRSPAATVISRLRRTRGLFMQGTFHCLSSLRFESVFSFFRRDGEGDGAFAIAAVAANFCAAVYNEFFQGGLLLA